MVPKLKLNDESKMTSYENNVAEKFKIARDKSMNE